MLATLPELSVDLADVFLPDEIWARVFFLWSPGAYPHACPRVPANSNNERGVARNLLASTLIRQ